MYTGAGATLGDLFTPTAEALAVSATPPAVVAWSDSVKKRGGVVTRMNGTLVARFGVAAPFVYEPASLSAQAADANRAVADATRIVAVKALDAVQGGARAVLDAPRAVAAQVLGIPKSAVTVLIVLGVAGAAAYKLGVFKRKKR
jgi:hypothetical protein